MFSYPMCQFSLYNADHFGNYDLEAAVEKSFKILGVAGEHYLVNMNLLAPTDGFEIRQLAGFDHPSVILFGHHAGLYGWVGGVK